MIEREVYLSAGSNLGNKKDNLIKAIEILRDDNKISDLKVSAIYKTQPVGGVEQDDFYNIAIRLNTSYSPRELLNKIHQIETALKRIRLIHWGPRTIDLDILFYDDQKIQEDDLVVPHPEIQNRRFVLIPMLEIVDNSELKKKIEIMLVNTPDKNKVEKYEEIY